MNRELDEVFDAKIEWKFDGGMGRGGRDLRA
jgi:hypothetical protein